MELALIMFLCENSFHARFIRLFYSFTFRCMELALIMFLCENSFHARFIRLFYLYISVYMTFNTKCI